MKHTIFLSLLCTVAIAQETVSPVPAKPAPGPKLALPGAPGENPGPKRAKKPGGPTIITSSDATFKNSTQTAEFKGDVNVKAPDFEISCDRLKIILKKKPAPGTAPADAAAQPDDEGGMGNIEEAIAEGNVIITQDKPAKPGEPPSRYLAKGKRAVFTNSKGSVVITGWPQILESQEGKPTKQTNALEESTRVTLFQSNDMIIEGRSEVILHGKQQQ